MSVLKKPCHRSTSIRAAKYPVTGLGSPSHHLQGEQNNDLHDLSVDETPEDTGNEDKPPSAMSAAPSKGDKTHPGAIEVGSVRQHSASSGSGKASNLLRPPPLFYNTATLQYFVADQKVGTKISGKCQVDAFGGRVYLQLFDEIGMLMYEEDLVKLD